ncbi:MAG: integrase arm-type DNA-binding domain-containing protein [Xanthobacteraceae bacterium]|nr:integrase arm-type DNA-binding domain-containing protein [Xanthobacteraceae bacterium]
MAHNKLTARTVASITKRGRHSDGGGLVLQVSRWGTKSWIFRYERNGRERHMGLGAAHSLSLAEARQRALACRKQLLDGVDPIEQRAAAEVLKQVDAARETSFEECAKLYIAAHESSWRNEKHRTQWKSTLRTYAYPKIGKLPVGAVDTTLVVKIIEPLWTSKPETAGRVRGRIESVLDWAKVRGMRDGENPARWKGHLDHLLPKRSKVARVRHHPALPYPDIPDFMAELRNRKGQGARALELAVLTSARTGAIIGATRSEVDLRGKVWTVPPERTGAKIIGEDPKPRRVPLSDRAVKIIEELPREEGNPYLFIGAKPGQPLSNMAMLELMRDMRPGYVPHGFRSSFKDWCSETTNYPSEVSEAALWHAIADEVEAAYRRGDLFEKRRRLMNDWARYCSVGSGSRSNTVVSING